jgi:hypothetical protein
VGLTVAGLISVPFLQQCCPDPPLPGWWPNPPNRSLLERLFFMDMAPRLGALAVVAGTASLAVVGCIYALTQEIENREAEARALGAYGILRAVAATFVVGVFYLYDLFVSGYFRLGWFNLVWIIGVPTSLAATTGRDEFERRWGGPFLIIPGFFAELALMIALGIDLY